MQNKELYVKATGNPIHRPGPRRLEVTEVDKDGAPTAWRDIDLITKDTVATVPNESYYRRMLARGELIEVNPAEEEV